MTCLRHPGTVATATVAAACATTLWASAARADLPASPAASGAVCPARLGAAGLPVVLTPARGALRVAWTAPPSKPNGIHGWLVTAVDETSPGSHRWITVPAGSGCRRLSVTIPGLRRHHAYVVWLEAVVDDSSTAGPIDVAVAETDSAVLP